MNTVCHEASAEITCGLYKFTIHKYSQAVKTVGEMVKSPVFNLCGNSWQLHIYPGGDKTESNGFVSVYLVCTYFSTKRLKVTFRLGLSSVDLEEKSDHWSKEMIFGSKLLRFQNRWGSSVCFKESRFSREDSVYCRDDSATFLVEIKVNQGLVKANKSFDSSSSTGHSLPNSLHSLLDTAVGADVTLIVGIGANLQWIPAHKCILMARSEVFKAMFTHNMSESNTNEIVISDFSPEAIREMLHFMYTDTLDLDTMVRDIVGTLLAAANKYVISGLVSQCETYFGNKLSHDNAVSTLVLAESCGSFALKTYCLDYIVENAGRIAHRSDFPLLVDKVLTLRAQQGLSTVATRREIEGVVDPCTRPSVGEKRKLEKFCLCDESSTVKQLQNDGCVIM